MATLELVIWLFSNLTVFGNALQNAAALPTRAQWKKSRRQGKSIGSCRIAGSTFQKDHHLMNEAAITNYITETFPKVETGTNFGYTFFFYASDHKLPFATLSSSDNGYDSVSHLDRTGIFRLNIGVSKQAFQSLFTSDPVDVSSYDFTVLDTLMPHPEYARQHFICVLNPSRATWEQVRFLLAEAYDLARRRNAKRTPPE
jgi:hypothetical protein